MDDCGIGVRLPSESKISLFPTNRLLVIESFVFNGQQRPMLPGIKRLEIEAVHIRLLQSLEMRGVIPSLHHSRREQEEIYHVETVVQCYV
jgi:hypothetical protein